MFDVSFSELVLILIVGLLVFGPEKLPEVVRTAGLWMGKMRRTFNQVRTEIEREVGVDELKRDFHNHTIMQNLKDVHSDLQRTQDELQQLPYEVSEVVQRANNSTPINTNTSADTNTSVNTAPAITEQNVASQPADNPPPSK